jgi:hypothetical protein
VVNRLSADLKAEFSDMWLSPRNLWNMKRFYERYFDSDLKLQRSVAVLQVMLNSDLALLYGTETKFINRVVWI